MRLIDADALAEKKFQERECNGLGEGPAYRQGWNDAIDAVMDNEPSAQPKEVIPHRNYKYLSDYWCECGWHLGKKGEVKYCPECGRKVNWDE